jgi:predicted nucleic acid-binding protein
MSLSWNGPSRIHDCRRRVGSISNVIRNDFKATQQSLGLSLDENDLWIAASASAMGCTVISRDADLHHVQGLAVVDWTV